MTYDYPMAEPWMKDEHGNVIRGDAITAYHRRNHTASYHCIECGAEMSGWPFKCKLCGHDHSGKKGR